MASLARSLAYASGGALAIGYILRGFLSTRHRRSSHASINEPVSAQARCAVCDALYNVDDPWRAHQEAEIAHRRRTAQESDDFEPTYRGDYYIPSPMPFFRPDCCAECQYTSE